MVEDNNVYTEQHALSLKYDGEGAPNITASGAGRTAEEIIQLAIEHEIPIQQNEVLMDVLKELPVGSEVPESLYVAVAEILAFAYKLTGKDPFSDVQQTSKRDD